jgi:predicted nucleotide-binding protein
MPSSIFVMKDKRYLITAYAEGSTHGRMNAFESGLGFFTTQDSNKTERASTLINHLFEQPNTDELVIDLLNHTFVENPYGDSELTGVAASALRKHVLEPRGLHLTNDGFRIKQQRATTAETNNSAHGAPDPAKHTGMAQGFDKFVGVTESPETKVTPPPESAPSRTVFVVHGRDMRPVVEIERFLLFLGLTMMSWSDAVKLTGETQPHTYDIVKAGMDNASAIVVIFSPDDEARVKRHFASPGESPDPMGQARQNVLVEAGMAFAQSRKKTIFVQSEHTRPISDLEGFNWVSLDGEWDSRQDFIHRLEAAGAQPKPTHVQLTHRTAGHFKVV